MSSLFRSALSRLVAGVLLANVLANCWQAQAAPPSSPAEPVNRHSLGEFGPYKSPGEAAATLEKALKAIVAQGGGMLWIPRDAPQGFYPRNLVQSALGEPAVTVIDMRGGVERTYVPPVGAGNSQGDGAGCRLFERDLATNLPWQGCYPTVAVVSRYPGGSSSWLDRISRPARKGTDARFYVPTLRGLFVGQTLRVTGQPEGYGGEGEYVTVKALGLDGNDPYFVALARLDHPAHALAYNKNVVNGLTVLDSANCDNQSMSMMVSRADYGNGDRFVYSAGLYYQGNVMSAAGDEGGLCYGADIVQDPDAFRGSVEKWDPKTGTLIYKPGARCPQKLGMSRPILNMNPKKWLTAGKVRVVPPGYAFLRDKTEGRSLVVAGDDAPWDESLAGRFFAIDEPSEYYAPDEAFSSGYAGPPGQKMHRWWHVTKVEPRKAGGWNLYVERTFWWTSREAGPTLMRFDNYSTDENHQKPLRYIIAPGAWAADVRFGVCGDRPGNVGVASAADERRLLLAPSTSAGTRFDYEPGDPIMQPLGPDPWLPTGIRVRHHQGFPGCMSGASFDSTNWGKVAVGAALAVGGPTGTLDEILKGQKDGRPSYVCGVDIAASTSTAIKVSGPVQEAALDLWQYDGNAKTFQWRQPKGVARFHVDPKTSNFTFTGGQIDLQDRGAVRQGGLSATASPAHNLRGINLPVPKGAKELYVAFATPETDAVYSLTVQPNWLTRDAVTEKKPTGFKVVFDTPADEGARIDWQLIR